MDIKISIFVLLIALVALGGCRREDVKEFSQKIPNLDREKMELITKTLSEQTGVLASELKGKIEEGIITIKYDSMSLAKENIRQAIEGKINEILPRN